MSEHPSHAPTEALTALGGEIEFVGKGNPEPSKFIVVSIHFLFYYHHHV